MEAGESRRLLCFFFRATIFEFLDIWRTLKKDPGAFLTKGPAQGACSAG